MHVKGSDNIFRLETTDATGKCTMTFWDPSGQKAYFGYGSGSSDIFYIAQQENADIHVHTNSLERMRITSGGYMGFNNTSPSFTSGTGIHLGDSTYLGFGAGGNSRPDFQIGASSGASLDIRCGNSSDTTDFTISSSATLTGDLNDTSDERLKTNIQDISGNQINIVKQLRPVTFDWKATDKGSNTGFIAQEVIKLLPNDVSHAVPTDTDTTLGINQMGVTAVLTKALQEAIARIETLETKVAALEAG